MMTQVDDEFGEVEGLHGAAKRRKARIEKAKAERVKARGDKARKKKKKRKRRPRVKTMLEVGNAHLLGLFCLWQLILTACHGVLGGTA